MNSTTASTAEGYPFLHGGGQLGEIIARFNWAATSLGDIAHWPQSLKTTVALILRSPVPIVTLWGEDGVMIYNDAYSVFAAGRHPQALGANVREGWPEVADFNDHVMKVGLAGDTLAYVDQELTLHRSGKPEQVWMNLDYSPLLDEAGKPAGVMAIVVETTAKVRAERWLSGERDRLSAMFEQAPGFMAMLTGPDHVFTLVNDAYARLVGHREVLGKPVGTALPEAFEQGFVGLLDQLYASGETYSGTSVAFWLQMQATSAPQQRFLDFVYQPLKDEHGNVFGIFVQGSDVTDRVLAEQSVQQSELTFRTLAQGLPSQIWAAPASGVLDWFNDRIYEYAGAAEGDLDDGQWARIVHPDDLPAVQQSWAAAVASGITYESEFRVRRADGAYRWHLVRALPVRDDADTVVRWLGTNTDIEDQKAAADALLELNATLEQAVAQRTAERDRMWLLATDTMLVADSHGLLLTVNPAFTRLLQWTEAEIAGTPFLSLVHPDDLMDASAEVALLRQGQQTFKLENRFRCKDGSYKILSWTAGLDDGAIYAVGRDITAEREAAQAIRRTELALQQSQKMETIGKLTGGVAHDFNNLLQVISGNLQLLAREVRGNPKAERRLDNAMAGVSRGAKLASYLLAFGRRQALEPKVVKISRFITEMEDMLHRSLGEEIEIELAISGGLWNTFVDTTQVENAVLNLCINARDAMDGAGKLTIEVGNAFLDEAYARSQTEVTPGQYVMIAVSDTGSGMTPDVLHQAFEPFFSTKPEGKGTGLGLSMVFGFVKQSGGHVKIYSEVDHGTTVKLYLPRSFETEDMPGQLGSQAVEGGTETVLVAEDDEGVRGTVVEMLTELGYRVLKASDAASALTVIDSGIPIDLLFTDVVMPGPLRSPDLARKARERVPNIAVLFTSGYTENAIVHGGRLDAGVELLGKPYTREALARKVRHVLANRQQRQQVLARPEPLLHAGVLQTPQCFRILLVEDEEDIRVNTAELLEYLGQQVTAARDAEQALAVLKASPVDVLITDISLPGISGEALAAQARALLPQISVVFASGQHHDTTLEGAMQLRKPYDTASISSVLQVLGNKPA
ncbi:Blue-light-activated protein [Andreprevotia sp. IGB-42]|uniref:PAS domain S-box protein n=1 Tax=Andreprevotia sp. IGB-42 TaxID=2497473 RepID=UPI001356897A|nr:PAS domain S-box protein [Andreprevotia sp. IGB-42]KAF0813144.1 Blue-light-activated protein [Andreprevotia sp. IGB-42]